VSSKRAKQDEIKVFGNRTGVVFGNRQEAVDFEAQAGNIEP
jgi:hypothetical protein